jgi:hypothetical protein
LAERRRPKVCTIDQQQIECECKGFVVIQARMESIEIGYAIAISTAAFRVNDARFTGSRAASSVIQGKRAPVDTRCG